MASSSTTSRRSPRPGRMVLGIAASSAATAACSGSSRSKVVPLSSTLLTSIRPPMLSMMRWHDTSPRPVPLGLVVKNGLNKRCNVASSMPMPSSLTRMRTCSSPCASRQCSATRLNLPPSGMAWMALSARFNSTCCNSV
ncbi:hypothetical protein D3C81_1351570 [compost metagenome]